MFYFTIKDDDVAEKFSPHHLCFIVSGGTVEQISWLLEVLSSSLFGNISSSGSHQITKSSSVMVEFH